MRAVLIVLAYMAALVAATYLLLGPGLDLVVRLWQSRPLWMQPGLIAARHAVDSTTIDALTMANIDLTERCKALDAEVCALRAINGNKTDTPDAAFRDALRDRDAAVLQLQCARAVNVDLRAENTRLREALHKARVVGVAHEIVEADATPAHGMPRPRRVIGRLG